MQGVREILAAELGRGRADAADAVAKDALIQQHRECWEGARERDSNEIFALALELHARSHPSVASAASAAPLLSLRRILISELRAQECHVGRVLYGTLLERPWKISAIQTLLEDEAGGLVKVDIYHAVPPSAKMSALEALYPKGLKVAIKEPFFELYGDRSVGVRVDNPADIVVLRGTGPRRTAHEHSAGGEQGSKAQARESLAGGSNAREAKDAVPVDKQGGKPTKKKRAQQKKLQAAEDEQAEKWLTDVCSSLEKAWVEPGHLAAEPAGGSLAHDDGNDSSCSVD